MNSLKESPRELSSTQGFFRTSSVRWTSYNGKWRNFIRRSRSFHFLTHLPEDRTSRSKCATSRKITLEVRYGAEVPWHTELYQISESVFNGSCWPVRLLTTLLPYVTRLFPKRVSPVENRKSRRRLRGDQLTQDRRNIAHHLRGYEHGMYCGRLTGC